MSQAPDCTWELPLIVAVEQVPNVHEYLDLFPYLVCTLGRAVPVGCAPRVRDWYVHPPPFAPAPPSFVPAPIPNGPLCQVMRIGAVTSTNPRRMEIVAQTVQEWKENGRPSDKEWFSRKRVKQSSKLVRMYQLIWSGFRYVLPSQHQLMRLMGYSDEFTRVLVYAYTSSKLEVGNVIPNFRCIVGNGWNFHQALHAISHVSEEPSALVEICSGSGPLAWILAQRHGGRLQRLRLVVQVEKDPGLQRVAALVFMQLRTRATIPRATTLVQVADVWDLVRNPHEAKVRVYRNTCTPEMDPPTETMDLSPPGLVALMHGHGAEYSTAAVAAGPPCTGFAGLNFTPGIGGRQRLANKESFAAFPVSLFIWNMHRHLRGGPLSQQDVAYLSGIRPLLSDCLAYALDHGDSKEQERRKWLLDSVDGWIGEGHTQARV